MKKRIFTLLTALSICWAAALPAAAADGTKLTISAPETLPAVGETFTVTVSIESNPGISAAQFTVASDDSVVRCVSAQLGEILSGALAATNPAASDGAIIAAANTRPMTGDGTLSVLTYEVVTDGDAAFALEDVILTGTDDQNLGFTAALEKTASEKELDTSTGVSGDGMGGAAPAETPVTAPSTSAATAAKPEVTAPTVTTETAPAFTDVPADYWAADYIAAAVDKGLFQGYADGSFRPSASVTRIQFITVLWRAAGRPAASSAAPFTDLDTAADNDFAKAAAWGYAKGYITGYENADGTLAFRPTGTITRQQAMAILYRYNGAAAGTEAMLTGIYDSQFSDSGQLAAYAKPAMYWAVYNGYISGTSAATLSPAGLATRAQLAKILVGYLDKTA